MQSNNINLYHAYFLNLNSFYIYIWKRLGRGIFRNAIAPAEKTHKNPQKPPNKQKTEKKKKY